MELVNCTWSKHCTVRRQGELTTSFADCLLGSSGVDGLCSAARLKNLT
jgi:hypothetical protein